MLVVLHSQFVGRNTSYFCHTYHKQTSFLLSSVLISFDRWQNIAEAATALEVWPWTDHCNSVLFVSMWCFLMEALQSMRRANYWVYSRQLSSELILGDQRDTILLFSVCLIWVFRLLGHLACQYGGLRRIPEIFGRIFCITHPSRIVAWQYKIY